MTAGRLVVLSGPTASGKSSLALALAREFPVEIVNADSLQVYRRFDIGTAKPTAAERDEVPHHLIDVADPGEPYDAGRYVRDAERAIREIRARGKVPMLVGGTGMYIRALLRGLDQRLADETGLPIMINGNPLHAVARGAGHCLAHLDACRGVLVDTSEL